MAGQFMIFFALLLTGYGCKKAKIIDEGMNRSINSFIINVAYPCLIIERIGSLEMEEGIFGKFLIILLLSGGFLALYGAYSFWYAKLRKFSKKDSGVAEFAMMSSNNGFMGFPIAFTFFGEYGLLYMVACNLSLNIMFFSYGIHLMTRNESHETMSAERIFKSVLKLIVNPKIVAAALGLIICGYEIQVPETMLNYLDLVGSIATPMAMIFIGSTLAGSRLLNIVKNKLILEIAVSKLFILPALTILILIFLPLDPMIKSICVLSCALPTATTVPIFAQQYEKNKDLASEALFFSTIVSLFSIPGIIAIIPLLY